METLGTYRISRELPGIYYAEMSSFSYESLVQLRRDLNTTSDLFDEYKDVVIWEFTFNYSLRDTPDMPSITRFIRNNAIDYGYTIIITNNALTAPIMRFFHNCFPKLLGDVSFAKNLEEAVEMALLIQAQNVVQPDGRPVPG